MCRLKIQIWPVRQSSYGSLAGPSLEVRAGCRGCEESKWTVRKSRRCGHFSRTERDGFPTAKSGGGDGSFGRVYRRFSQSAFYSDFILAVTSWLYDDAVAPCVAVASFRVRPPNPVRTVLQISESNITMLA